MSCFKITSQFKISTTIPTFQAIILFFSIPLEVHDDRTVINFCLDLPAMITVREIYRRSRTVGDSSCQSRPSMIVMNNNDKSNATMI